MQTAIQIITYMNKFILSGIVLFTLIATSCKKNLIESPTGTPLPTATKVDEIKASESFKWKTTKTVSVDITGLKSPVAISRTLQVTAIDGKDVYFKSLQLISENKTISFIVPATITDIQISYGKIIKKVSLNGTHASFSFTN